MPPKELALLIACHEGIKEAREALKELIEMLDGFLIRAEKAIAEEELTQFIPEDPDSEVQ